MCFAIAVSVADGKPLSALVAALSDNALRCGTLVWDLPGSFGLHWNDGVIMVNADRNWLDGKVKLGPDCRLYLTQ